MSSPEPLQLVETLSGWRYTLQGKPLYGGDTVAMCFSGGWVVGHFGWSSDLAEAPRFYCSIELQGGDVEKLDIAIPERALLRREAPGPVLPPARATDEREGSP